MRRRGFTLLEVLVAVAILGLGLTAILSAQAGAFASASHARNLSLATGLLRCKMSEVEEHLYREGFQETDESGAGPCCETDETPNMRCTWRADRPTFPEAKFGDLNLGAGLDLAGAGGPAGAGNGANPLGALGLLAGMGGPSPLGSASSVSDIAKTLADSNASAASPGGSSSPVPSPSPSGQPLDPNADPSAAGGAMGGLASMAMSFVYPSLKLLFEASTRRITATLTFREGKKEYSIDVVEWFSVPQKGLAPTDDSATNSTTPTGASSASSSGSAGRTSSGGIGGALKAPTGGVTK
jgi:general secretion pathway protein I